MVEGGPVKFNKNSSSAKPVAMILCGDGINCERETAAAFEAAGFVTITTHVNELVARPRSLSGVQALALPGGFSFGDELGSGQILAAKLRKAAGDELHDFVARRRPVIGICNGFQALVKLGLLPWPEIADQPDGQETPRHRVALAHNASGQFINRWVEVDFPDSVCVWTRGLSATSFPVRHGEGRVFAGDSAGVLSRLREHKQIALQYREDFNGSLDRIAGLCDPTGVVFGLMPHPEAALADWLHPTRAPGSARGLEIFNNARRYLDEL